MSDIFDINGSKVASVDYVNEILKMVEDHLRNTDDNFDGFKSISTEDKEIKLESGIPFPIAAQDISQDHNHNFVSGTLLSTFADKPSSFEVEKSLEDIKIELRKNLNEYYMRIINTPNAIDKLNDISNLLNDDEILNNLVDTLSNKVPKETFEEHVGSVTHMNNNDRKALNMLIEVLKIGTLADWNANEKSANYIANKPESLPANGGNADTVENHPIKDIACKPFFDITICNKDTKNKDLFDAATYAITNNTLGNIIENGGNVFLANGTYSFNIDSTNQDNIIKFTGSNATISDIASAINKMTFKDLTIKGSIKIGKECDFDNVVFNDCKITLSNAEGCNIKFCKFINCEFEIDPTGFMINNLFLYNRFVNTEPLKFIGGNNTIINL